MMIAYAVFFTFTLAVFGQENTCPKVLDCLDSGAKENRHRRAEILREIGGYETSLGDCGQEEAEELASKLEQMKALQQERQEKVARCVDGDVSAFPGCLASFPSNLNRVCVANRREYLNLLLAGREVPRGARTPRQAPRRGNLQQRMERLKQRREMRQDRRQECKASECGCPEAKVCHECYELSDIHDQIKGLKLDMYLTLLECGVPLPPRNGEKGPQKDESLMVALTE